MQGTFTVTNLGMYGIDEFNGIINTPQSALLAVSAVVREPVVEGDQIVPGQTMNMTLSSDHRIVDGAAAAEFLSIIVAASPGTGQTLYLLGREKSLQRAQRALAYVNKQATA